MKSLPRSGWSVRTIGAVLSVGIWAASAAFSQSTVRVSVGLSIGAGFPDGPSDFPSVSADGRYVAFVSRATNLLPGNLDRRQLIYVRDRQSGMTARVSVASGGALPDADCGTPSISGDGRYVVFESRATNLVPGASAGASNIYRRDLVAGVTVCVSVGHDGAPADGGSFFSAVSDNGRYVAFGSGASNLVADDTNDQEEVFVRDMVAGLTRRVALAADGGPSDTYSYRPAISADGRYVAFVAGDGNLVPGDANDSDDIFVRDTVANTTERASVGLGAESNSNSDYPALSADGGRVAFQSRATNLVPNDGNNANDVFLRDLAAGTTQRVSVAANGGEAPQGGTRPAISGDGARIAFESASPSLSPDDTNGAQDIFVRDTAASTTTRVSVAGAAGVANGGSAVPDISADGKIVAFSSSATNLAAGDQNALVDVFLRDTQAGATHLASVATEDRLQSANVGGAWSRVNQDGRYVAFYSSSSNLVPDDTNGITDVFVRDTWSNTTERVSVSSSGAQATGSSVNFFGQPGISADGRYVAFVSASPNLVASDDNNAVDVFVRDRGAGATTRVSVGSGGIEADSQAAANQWPSVALSADGRYVVFTSTATNLVPDDTNNDVDVFLRDTVAGTTERVNLTAAGGQAERGVTGTFLSISADGNRIAFDSYYDLVLDEQVGKFRSFVRDRGANTTRRLPGNALDGNLEQMDTGGVQISADGRYVAFTTYIAFSNPAARGVYVLDLDGGGLTLVSRTPGGGTPNDGSWFPAISADGRFVAFYSYATNLVPGDTNGHTDVFRWDRTTDAITRVNPTADGGQGNQDSSDASISGDGRYVTFDSFGNNFVPGDTNNNTDVFIHGPLPDAGLPYTVPDLQAALRIAGGVLAADAAAFGRLNVVSVDTGPNVVDRLDAARLARKAAGLDPDP